MKELNRGTRLLSITSTTKKCAAQKTVEREIDKSDFAMPILESENDREGKNGASEAI